MKNIRFFCLKIFIFLKVKFLGYLNRHAFVMCLSRIFATEKKKQKKTKKKKHKAVLPSTGPACDVCFLLFFFS